MDFPIHSLGRREHDMTIPCVSFWSRLNREAGPIIGFVVVMREATA
jgi:hypothetical protein